MSSDPVPPPAAPPGDTGARSTDRIIVYRHSHLFYWWPMWLLGFIFAGVTYFDDMHLAIVPAGTVAAEKRNVDVDGKKNMEEHDVLILPKEGKRWTRTNDDGKPELIQPTIFIPRNRTLGTIYTIVLLLVIVITNISIRGLWTVFVLISVIMLTLIFWAAGWWETIFEKLNQLSIYINMGAYLLISIVLFILWLFNFALFDRQMYMIFTPGQVRVRQEVGGEETVYDTTGMVVQRARNDMFRHWILGFASGDLTIKPVGVANPIEFPNVLFVGAKVTKIENMIKEKVIVKGNEPKPPNA